MSKGWNSGNASKFISMDSHFMEKRQVRAMANYFRTFHDADSFVRALEHARALDGAGDLASAAVWNQIAEEISQMETNEVLQRCLKRDREQVAAADS